MIAIIAFVLGFFVGVFERKVDRLKVNLPKAKESELLKTPSQEELDKIEAKEFYDKII